MRWEERRRGHLLSLAISLARDDGGTPEPTHRTVDRSRLASQALDASRGHVLYIHDRVLRRDGRTRPERELQPSGGRLLRSFLVDGRLQGKHGNSLMLKRLLGLLGAVHCCGCVGVDVGRRAVWCGGCK
jgi:hypothetical protein